MNKIKRTIKTVCLALAGVMGIAAQAETYTWRGGDAFTPENWVPATEDAEGAVPTAADNVVYDRAEVFTLDNPDGSTLACSTFTAGADAVGIHVTTNTLADGTVATNTLDVATLKWQGTDFTITGGGVVDANELAHDKKPANLTVNGSRLVLVNTSSDGGTGKNVFQSLNLTAMSNAALYINARDFYSYGSSPHVVSSRISLIEGSSFSAPGQTYTSNALAFQDSILAVTNSTYQISRDTTLKGQSTFLVGLQGFVKIGYAFRIMSGGYLCVDGQGASFTTDANGAIGLLEKDAKAEIKNGGTFSSSKLLVAGENSRFLVDGGVVSLSGFTGVVGRGKNGLIKLSNGAQFTHTPSHGNEYADGFFLEGTNFTFRVETGSRFSLVQNQNFYLGTHPASDKNNKHSAVTSWSQSTCIPPYAPKMSLADDAVAYVKNNFYAQSDNPDEAARPILEFELTEKTKAEQSLLQVGGTATLSNLVVNVTVPKESGLLGLFKLAEAGTLKVAGVNIGTATDDARAEALRALAASARLANGVTLEFGADNKSLYARIRKPGFSVILR